VPNCGLFVCHSFVSHLFVCRSFYLSFFLSVVLFVCHSRRESAFLSFPQGICFPVIPAGNLLFSPFAIAVLSVIPGRESAFLFPLSHNRRKCSMPVVLSSSTRCHPEAKPKDPRLFLVTSASAVIRARRVVANSEVSSEPDHEPPAMPAPGKANAFQRSDSAVTRSQSPRNCRYVIWPSVPELILAVCCQPAR
jgi:hypothetical protein